MNKKIIPIFYTIDDNFVKYALVSLQSLISNASTDYIYHIHIIYDDISDINKKYLRNLQNNYVKIIFNQMNKIEAIKDKINNYLRASIYTLTIYFRIFIPSMFKEYDKVIYIDADTIINKDISLLYNEDISNYYLGACIDKSILDNETLVYYINEALGLDENKYINSGVLLMNAKLLREKHLSEKFLYFLKRYEFDCIAPDQDYLNVLCYNHIKFLDSKYDAMPSLTYESINDPVIIHYNLFFKPWNYKEVQYEEYFWKYAKDTVYYEEIKNILANYSEEDKKKDEDSMQLMEKRAKKIPMQEVTFKNVFKNIKERL